MNAAAITPTEFTRDPDPDIGTLILFPVSDAEFPKLGVKIRVGGDEKLVEPAHGSRSL